MQDNWQLYIDTGGTFTDCIAYDPLGKLFRAKVLSSSKLRGQVVKTNLPQNTLYISQNWGTPANIFEGYAIHIFGVDHPPIHVVSSDINEGILRLSSLPKEVNLDGKTFELQSDEEAPILAARILTATPRHQPLPPIAMRLGSTKGTNALLEHKGAKVALLITKGFGDLLQIGTQQRPDLFALDIQKPQPLYDSAIEIPERLDAQGTVLQPLTPEAIATIVEQVQASDCDAVALVLMHAYRNPLHEQQIAEALRAAGILYVSASHEIAPAVRLLPRAETTVINAYLAQVIETYLSAVKSKLEQGELKVMTSAGGLVDHRYFLPKDSLLSGPAGGVVGAAHCARQADCHQILTLDMGGTSTDVAHYDHGYDYRYESKVGDAHLLSPSMAIETVAAGGGSICQYDGYKLLVGPESAGAHPGPAAYGAGGPLCLTDVNLLMGYLASDAFGIPLNQEKAEAALLPLMEASGLEREALLEGLLAIANEKMAEAIRHISVQKGYDPKAYALLAFGGAGGQHACSVAELLEIDHVIIPFDAGLLSAVGMGAAVIERFAERQVLQRLGRVEKELEGWVNELRKEAIDKLSKEGFGPSEIEIQSIQLFLRLEGQDHQLAIDYSPEISPLIAFRQTYEQLYGHWIAGKELELASIKVQAVSLSTETAISPNTASPNSPSAYKHQDAYVEGRWLPIPLYDWEKLEPGATLQGPALVLNQTSTLLVKPHWTFYLDEANNAHLNLEQISLNQAITQTHQTPIQLELFTNRFRAIVEEMGALLERTAFSVNVKERLDFSCAMLDANAELVVNAPHIPVHLGSLGLCVRKVLEVLPLAPGDVAITNHPGFGGSHLPDITLIQGVFDKNNHLVGYVANRAHHAELGGKRPGSMPPDAKSLAEEGVVIPPMYLVRDGQPQWETIEDLLTNDRHPTRALTENIADLNGGLASLQVGVQSLKKLCEVHGSDRVSHYLKALKQYAASRMQTAILGLKDGMYEAEEFLDDGACIRVAIAIQGAQAHLDFTGTSPVHPGNLNANPAIVNSAILYVLRLLLAEDLPLNEGLMETVELTLPLSMLNPLFPKDPTNCPAVVGGNTETSQRLVDTLLKALGVSACSQGTMNNLLFGNETFGYYETIGGGTGAGPGFHGAHAVHQHMTNTRITDPEILELRYPVRLERFAIRRGSGGMGKWNGGDGIIRELRFLEPVSLTVLTQHREVAPYGLEGGGPGKKGRQSILKADGYEIALKGIDEAELAVGDMIVMETPGGGGWGS